MAWCGLRGEIARGPQRRQGEFLNRRDLEQLINRLERFVLAVIAMVAATTLTLTGAASASAPTLDLLSAPSPYSYDYRPDVARPPPVDSVLDDREPNSDASDPAGERGRVLRAPLRSSEGFVAPSATPGAPRVGSGASLDNLTPGEITRIQNAANKIDQPISVVGSRASGTAGPYSDWDYVVPGANSSTVGKIKNSLPEGPRGIGDPRNIDIFRGQVNEDLPFITFTPTPR